MLQVDDESDTHRLYNNNEISSQTENLFLCPHVLSSYVVLLTAKRTTIKVDNNLKGLSNEN
jgi:hypothetical protein